MRLYHGSAVVVEKPRIIRSEIGRDFGFAFYATDVRDQAIRWARRKAILESRKTGTYVVPIVSCYEWDKEKSMEDLKVKHFKGSDMEWLEMVVNCRSKLEYLHSFDIVEGKIANDNVGETVSYVIMGIMRKEDAIKRLEFEKINNQIAFCTEEALNYLHYISYFECR